MCSPVCFYLIFFLYKIDDVPRKNAFRRWISPEKMVFGFVSTKNRNRCPRKSGLSSLYDSLLCLHLCRARCLSLRLKLRRMATLLGKSHSFCSSSELSRKSFMYFLSQLVSVLGYKFNCIDSWSIYCYLNEYFLPTPTIPNKFNGYNVN